MRMFGSMGRNTNHGGCVAYILGMITVGAAVVGAAAVSITTHAADQHHSAPLEEIAASVHRPRNSSSRTSRSHTSAAEDATIRRRHTLRRLRQAEEAVVTTTPTPNNNNLPNIGGGGRGLRRRSTPVLLQIHEDAGEATGTHRSHEGQEQQQQHRAVAAADWLQEAKHQHDGLPAMVMGYDTISMDATEVEHMMFRQASMSM